MCFACFSILIIIWLHFNTQISCISLIFSGLFIKFLLLEIKFWASIFIHSHQELDWMPPRWGKTLMGSGSREVNRHRLRLRRPTVRWPPLGASLMGCTPRTSIYVTLCCDGLLTSVPRSLCGVRHTGDTLKFLLIFSRTLFYEWFCLLHHHPLSSAFSISAHKNAPSWK